MNLSMSKDPRSLFLNLLVCTNTTFNENLEGVSRMILVNSELKKRKDGKTNRLEMFKTEEERIEALKREFGIILSEEEKEGINGQKLAIENFDSHTKQFAS